MTFFLKTVVCCIVFILASPLHSSGNLYSQEDQAIYYDDRVDRWEGIHPPENMAGVYVNLVGFQLIPGNTTSIDSIKFMTLKLILPENVKIGIEVRESINDYLMRVKPNTLNKLISTKKHTYSWPTGEVLKKLTKYRSLNCNDLAPLLFKEGSSRLEVYPVILTSKQKSMKQDTYSSYQFVFRPNVDIKVEYRFYKKGSQYPITPTAGQNSYGSDEFPILWDARINSKIADSGYYELCINGRAKKGYKRAVIKEKRL